MQPTLHFFKRISYYLTYLEHYLNPVYNKRKSIPVTFNPVYVYLVNTIHLNQNTNEPIYHDAKSFT